MAILVIILLGVGCGRNETDIYTENGNNAITGSSIISESTRISAQDGMEMVFVPNGMFSMGLDGGRTDEKPAHEVALDAFWIDRTEVTNAMYRLCMEAGVCTTPGFDKYYPYEEYSDFPVVYIRWDQANMYCEWAGRRLPTEAEWEKAARGTDALIYPWGNEAPSSNRLNYAREIDDIMPVGSFPEGVSPYGAYDLAGNAWEWVADWYDAHYYSISPQSNPTGPEDGNLRVCRGGSWIDYKGTVRSVQRASDMCVLKDPANASYKYRRGFVDNDLSFRCALDDTD
ncbi:MAG: SUMF1/EgtB/PvdO family nonheme iron enzyme [Anaerolineaceae bacterium]|nr:SUMF1/EgtB/PvdO family nonheme iron enzyme [Anaerolineaceae bacterium]